MYTEFWDNWRVCVCEACDAERADMTNDAKELISSSACVGAEQHLFSWIRVCVQFACLKLWGVRGWWEGFNLYCMGVYNVCVWCVCVEKDGTLINPFLQNYISIVILFVYVWSICACVLAHLIMCLLDFNI